MFITQKMYNHMHSRMCNRNYNFNKNIIDILEDIIENCIAYETVKIEHKPQIEENLKWRLPDTSYQKYTFEEYFNFLQVTLRSTIEIGLKEINSY